MSVAVASRVHPGRRARSFRIGAILGLAVPVLALLALSLVSRDTPPTSAPPTADLTAERAALTTFDDTLQPIIEAGASTIVYGMRPGINDIHSRAFDDDTLTTMAEGWVASMEGVRADYDAVVIPDFLMHVAILYADAFDAYLETAHALLAAAHADGDERDRLIEDAAAAGTRADEFYDTARAEHDRHRARVGMAAG